MINLDCIYNLKLKILSEIVNNSFIWTVVYTSIVIVVIIFTFSYHHIYFAFISVSVTSFLQTRTTPDDNIINNDIPNILIIVKNQEKLIKSTRFMSKRKEKVLHKSCRSDQLFLIFWQKIVYSKYFFYCLYYRYPLVQNS